MFAGALGTPVGLLTSYELKLLVAKVFHKVNYKQIIIIVKLASYLKVNPFQSSVAFHTEISHLISIANKMSGFYMK